MVNLFPTGLLPPTKLSPEPLRLLGAEFRSINLTTGRIAFPLGDTCGVGGIVLIAGRQSTVADFDGT